MSILRLIIGFFALVQFNTGLAQDQDHDDDAWSLLAPSECRFSGEFSQQQFLQGLETPLQSSGVFFYDCEHGIIWKTSTPIVESLVLNQLGDSYLVKRLKIEAIQSEQNKLLSQLIMALVGADKDYLSSLFDVSSDKPNQLRLTPSNRRLKRAIESISIAMQPATDENPEQITFEMVDRNQQTTSIVSTKLLSYAKDTDALANCVARPELSELECGLLKPTTP